MDSTPQLPWQRNIKFSKIRYPEQDRDIRTHYKPHATRDRTLLLPKAYQRTAVPEIHPTWDEHVFEEPITEMLTYKKLWSKVSEKTPSPEKWATEMHHQHSTSKINYEQNKIPRYAFRETKRMPDYFQSQDESYVSTPAFHHDEDQHVIWHDVVIDNEDHSISYPTSEEQDQKQEESRQKTRHAGMDTHNHFRVSHYEELPDKVRDKQTRFYSGEIKQSKERQYIEGTSVNQDQLRLIVTPPLRQQVVVHPLEQLVQNPNRHIMSLDRTAIVLIFLFILSLFNLPSSLSFLQRRRRKRAYSEQEEKLSGKQ